MIAFLAAGDAALKAADAAREYGLSRLGGNAPESIMAESGERLVWRQDELRLLPAVPRPGRFSTPR